MQTATHFRFDIFDMMSDLIYARVMHPCSKLKTYWEVIPKLFGHMLSPSTRFIPDLNTLVLNTKR